jgi:hypothetical protein
MLGEDVMKAASGPVAAGVTAVVLAPVVLPIIAEIARPIIKTAIKGGIWAYGLAAEGAAHVKEYAEDAYAEAQDELEHPERPESPKPKSARARKEGKPTVLVPRPSEI